MVDFERFFRELTGHEPFPWQIKLYNEFINQNFRASCPIPTGLGKTSIIPIWLLALAFHIKNGTVSVFPRRLVYVVNRRTVVDQATREAEMMRKALLSKTELSEITYNLSKVQAQTDNTPLAISTLRGQFADNAEWRDDPSRPSIIIGTVDMIGSRLLFSGYGCGFKSRPLHAGFLGQDTLLVHDEAHLEPAFQQLVEAIANEQKSSQEFKFFQNMELTATSRTDTGCDDALFTKNDDKHEEVSKRMKAKKGIDFHQVDDEKKLAEKVVQLAKKHQNSGQAILIFLRRLDTLNKVMAPLRKLAPDSVEALTGTLRGWERDKLAKENPVFARFMRNSDVTPKSGTVYLICTSAGEVGVNISSDHLICDLTPLDSMMQRFGRVNRFGEGAAQIDVVHHMVAKPAEAAQSVGQPTLADIEQTTDSETDHDVTPEKQSKKNKDKQISPHDLACERTLLLLQQLPIRDDQRRDACPDALSKLPAKKRQEAFTPAPVIPPVNEILFDAWAITTIRQKLPGRPPVSDWLHGIADWEPPETYVAWREEVDVITGLLLSKHSPNDLLDDYPVKPHEILKDQEKRIRIELEKIAGRNPSMPAWLIDSDGEIRMLAIEKLVEKDKLNKPLISLADCMVLLPPKAGGLENGLLNGDAAHADNIQYDIADQWLDVKATPRRCRSWDGQTPNGMRLIRTIDTGIELEDESDGEETKIHCVWNWYSRPRSADDDGSFSACAKQSLSSHHQSAEIYAKQLVAKLEIQEPESTAVIFAARCHDSGKKRSIWQRSIGNRDYPQEILAKSGPGMRSASLSNYRHEFGSLIDISIRPDFLELSVESRDLALHLVAAHHGRARPIFPGHEVIDQERQEETITRTTLEIPRRFARLQRKYGRWGLAYLESLVRAADIMASQDIAEVVPTPGGVS